ncbi:MAG: hypothetical protein QMD22_00040 [archaeon]|nr:hypothetical protein [archaeon]
MCNFIIGCIIRIFEYIIGVGVVTVVALVVAFKAQERYKDYSIKKAVKAYLTQYIIDWTEIRKKEEFKSEERTILARDGKNITETIMSRSTLLFDDIIREAKAIGDEIEGLSKITITIEKGDELAERAKKCAARIGGRR